MKNSTLLADGIRHPRKEIVPMAIGLGWGNDGAIYQEKLDGVFSTREVGSGVLGGERMANGQFIAWDCIAFDGQDVRNTPVFNRLKMMLELCLRFNLPAVQMSPDGGELLQAVLARGGEGIVRKLPGSTYYDAMTACKRLQTWVCEVTRLDYGTGGATIAERMADGEMADRGVVPLRNRATACRVGSLVKVEGLELTAGGKIREPRPCKDTATSWLLKF